MEYDLTSGQLATALAPIGVTVSAATIQRYACEGRIPSKRTLGGRYRYNLAEVQQTLATPTAVESRTGIGPSVHPLSVLDRGLHQESLAAPP